MKSFLVAVATAFVVELLIAGAACTLLLENGFHPRAVFLAGILFTIVFDVSVALLADLTGINASEQAPDDFDSDPPR